jgi:hypothetical protein
VGSPEAKITLRSMRLATGFGMAFCAFAAALLVDDALDPFRGGLFFASPLFFGSKGIALLRSAIFMMV